MKYLSIDLESTGLDQDCMIIEMAMVPFCTETGTVEKSLGQSTLIKCPSFEELRPKLNDWVAKNIAPLIQKAHLQGMGRENFKSWVETHLRSDNYRNYFGPDKMVIFGKSLNAIDLPFLNRDLGWDFMRQYFSHRVLDLSAVGHALADMGHLPKGSESGSKLMAHLGMGAVAHNALDDAINTADMYLKLIKQCGNSQVCLV